MCASAKKKREVINEYNEKWESYIMKKSRRRVEEYVELNRNWQALEALNGGIVEWCILSWASQEFDISQLPLLEKRSRFTIYMRALKEISSY